MRMTELPKFNIHRARDGRADWDLVDHADQNAWQRVARATAGIATPANAIDGAAMVADLAINENVIVREHKRMTEAARAGDRAKFRAAAKKKMAGLALNLPVTIFADGIDGMIADRTGTKSPLGEKIDGIGDGARAAEMILARLRTGDISPAEAIILGGPKILNGVAAAKKTFSGREVHSSFAAKSAEALRAVAFAMNDVTAILRTRAVMRDSETGALDEISAKNYEPDDRAYRVARSVKRVAMGAAAVAGFAVSAANVKSAFFDSRER